MEKYIFLIIILFLKTSLSFSQGDAIVQILDVDNTTNSINKTIPFDVPIVIRKEYSNSFLIYKAFVLEVTKKGMSDFYNYMYSQNGLCDILQSSSSGNSIQVNCNFNNLDKSKISKVFCITPFWGKNESTNKYILSIPIPPLSPNKFYEIILIRNPMSTELNDFYDLFEYYHYHPDDSIGLRRLTDKINLWKKPFTVLAGDRALVPQIYSTYLKQDYERLNNLKNRLSSFEGRANYDSAKAKIDPLIVSVKETIKNSIATQDINDLGFNLPVCNSLSASTVIFNFDTRTTFTVTPDFGYVYYGFQNDFNGVLTYLGLQIEFRYFNKHIPIQLIRNKTIWHRLSFTTGLSLNSLKSEGKREDFFTGKSLLAGLGVRLSNSVRFTFGSVIFYRENPDPLILDRKITVTPFSGLSIDIKLSSLLNDLKSLIPIKKK